MENFQEISKVVEKIDTEKEILSALPRNNEKNEQKYLEKVKELEKKYKKYKTEIREYLEKEYNSYIKVEENSEIELLKGRINTIEKVLYLLSDEKNSLEKMNLDRILYNLSRYYRNNLDDVNKEISECIRMFREVEINLTEDDFNYSEYTKEYMKVFLDEKDYSTSEKLKSKFEEIYWKCPEIIVQIGLNIRNIYLNKMNTIDKYFEKEKINLLKKWDKKPEEIIKAYEELKKKLEEKEEQDKGILLSEFLEGELKPQDYSKEKINEIYEKLIDTTDIDKDKINKNVVNFLNNIYEYKNYLNFQFIIEDIKEIYSGKEANKKRFAEIKKQIEINEKKLKKTNKGNIFKKETGKNIEQEKIIAELQELYKELDREQFNQKIYDNIKENSSLYEVLVYAKSDYSYMANCFIKNNPQILPEEIVENINELKKFMKSPYHTIMKNIHISDDKNIQIIIKDRYRLLNFKVEKEDLDEGNIDSLERNLKAMKMSLDLEKAGLDIEDIEIVCKMKDLLKKE